MLSFCITKADIEAFWEGAFGTGWLHVPLWEQGTLPDPVVSPPSGFEQGTAPSPCKLLMKACC